MQHSPNGDNLLAVYENGGFRSWNISNGKMVNQYDFISADKIGVNFSADGSWVITPGSITPNGLYGYRIWNTENRKLVDCWGTHCPNGIFQDIDIFNTGIVRTFAYGQNQVI